MAISEYLLLGYSLSAREETIISHATTPEFSRELMGTSGERSKILEKITVIKVVNKAIIRGGLLATD